MIWAPHGRIGYTTEGTTLCIHTPAASRVEWAATGDDTVHRVTGRDSTLGFWVAELETRSLAAGTEVRFRIFAAGASGAEISEEHVVGVVAASPVASPARAPARERVRG
jgi:hypothetical protein